MSTNKVRVLLCIAVMAVAATLGACGDNTSTGGGDQGTTTEVTGGVDPVDHKPDPDTGDHPKPDDVVPIPQKPAKVTAEPTTHSGPPSVFKACHGMHSTGTLFRDINRITGTTQIWSHCWLGGFTGNLTVLLHDADGDLLTWAVPPDSWGVNGLSEAAFGSPADRTVNWTAAAVDPAFLPMVDKITIVHTPAPRNRLVDILNEAVKVGKQVIPLLQNHRSRLRLVRARQPGTDRGR